MGLRALCFFAVAFCTVFSCALAEDAKWEQNFTELNLLTISPSADHSIVKALVRERAYLRSQGISNEARLIHLLTQFATETGGFRRLDENLSYSKSGLLAVFGKRIDAPRAARLAHHPQAIANFVYGNRLGNGALSSGDGWRYRGSGFIQLTGRLNFRQRGSDIGLPLEQNPDLARQPKIGLIAALSYWNARGISPVADSDDLKKIRVLINGRHAIGLPQAKIWYPIIRDAIVEGGAREISSRDVTTTADALIEGGYLQLSATERSNEVDVIKALKRFQRSRGIEASGMLDNKTLYAITDPRWWKPLYQADLRPINVGATEAAEDGDSGVVYDIASKTSKAVEGQADLASVVASNGTGIPAAERSLTSEEIDKFADAKPINPKYEAVGTSDPDHFVPFSIIEPDTRKAINNTTEYPYRAVVQILLRNGATKVSGTCSGAMVAANIVLTAGHCVHEGGRAGVWYTDFEIYPGRNATKKPFGVCGAKQLFSLRGWVESDDPDGDGRFYDLGAIELDCTVGESTGFFSLHVGTDQELKEKSTIIGYPSDATPKGRQSESVDKIRVVSPLKLFYQNDTYSGMSGSPVFGGTGNQLIAVHTNALHGMEPWSSNNAGTRLTDSIVRNLSTWMNSAKPN